MTALEYLESLIAGQKMYNAGNTSIPVQLPELEMLKVLMLQEKKNG